jgi:hypothetical protein
MERSNNYIDIYMITNSSLCIRTIYGYEGSKGTMITHRPRNVKICPRKNYF